VSVNVVMPNATATFAVSATRRYIEGPLAGQTEDVHRTFATPEIRDAWARFARCEPGDVMYEDGDRTNGYVYENLVLH